jgi:ABC-type Fe3+-hydroxamate transport system substrate-binding protein
MKKIGPLLSILLLLGSCGGGPTLSPEEVETKAQQQFEAMQSTLEQEAATNCEDKMDEYITFYKDSIEKAQVQAAIPTMDMN